METITGKISKVEKRLTRDEHPFVKIQIEDKTMSCFEQELLDQFVEGKTFTIEYEKGKGNFLNIKKVTEVSSFNTSTFPSPLIEEGIVLTDSERITKLEKELKAIKRVLADHMIDEWGHKI